MKGILRIVVLNTIAKGECSGYSIMKSIRQETGFWKPSPGSVYPLLNSLMKHGLITSRRDGRRILYKLTQEGREVQKRLRDGSQRLIEHVMQEMKLFESMCSKTDMKIMERVIKGKLQRLKRYSGRRITG